MYFGLIAVAAILVLIPGAPLGLATTGVQTLAGVLLPSATVFLLLLCSDRAVLGPWVNGLWTNLFTGAVIAMLVLLSVVLTASLLFPNITGGAILAILGSGGGAALIVAGVMLLSGKRAVDAEPALDRMLRPGWRMPALQQLPLGRIIGATRVWTLVLPGYVVVAVGMVVLRIVQLAAS